ncbi:hypothetical protein BH23GEM9_BH23GEM9_28950 [soil metagenome]
MSSQTVCGGAALRARVATQPSASRVPRKLPVHGALLLVALAVGCGDGPVDGGATLLVTPADALIETVSDSIVVTATLEGRSVSNLERSCVTPAGASITVWKWLRAMVEHEVHHRGQLYLMLAAIDVRTPPIFGLTSEQVRERSSPHAHADSSATGVGADRDA